MYHGYGFASPVCSISTSTTSSRTCKCLIHCRDISNDTAKGHILCQIKCNRSLTLIKFWILLCDLPCRKSWLGREDDLFMSSWFISLKPSAIIWCHLPHNQNTQLWEIRGKRRGDPPVTPNEPQRNFCASHLCNLGLDGFGGACVKGKDASTREHNLDSVKLEVKTESWLIHMVARTVLRTLLAFLTLGTGLQSSTGHMAALLKTTSPRVLCSYGW